MSTYLVKNENKCASWICRAVLGLALNSAHAANPMQVELVPISHISTYDLWSTMTPQQAESGEFVATYWPYDSESARQVDSQKICGLLLIGSPDVGSRPSGFEVRSRSCNYALGGLKAAAPTFYLRNREGGEAAIKITQDGKIKLRGKLLGRVRF